MRILTAMFWLALPLLAAEHGGGAEHAEPSIWWKWANFVLLAAFIAHMARKHLPPWFQSRTDEIQAGLKEAARMRETAERQVAEIEKRVANLQSEIANLKAEARKEMEAEAARIKNDTANTIARLESQAQFDIASATKLAATALKQKAAQLAVEIAAGDIRQRMTPAAQEQLVSSFVNQLPKAVRK